MKFGVGQAVTSVESERFVAGAGRYTDDISLAGEVFGVVVRSPRAHAEIVSIQTAAAEEMPGVLAVLTSEEADADGLGGLPCLVPVKNSDGSTCALPPWPIVQDDRVRYVGDPVAFVVAGTLQQARDAAEAIEVDYRGLPAVTATEEAPAAPPIRPEAADNLCCDWEDGDREATDRAFAGAAHVVSLKLVNNRLVGNPMEPRSALGEFDRDTGRYALRTSTQGVHLFSALLANAVFGVEPEQVHVTTADVGGAFGLKAVIYPEQVMVLWAAKRLGRPVRWTADRSESFISDTHARDHVTEAELALDAQGRFLAIRASTLANLGAYLALFGPLIPTEACRGMLTGVYDIAAAHVRVRGVFTNTVPVDAYRGAGRPEAAYVVERLVDVAAAELGLAPDEIRRRNFIPPQSMPYATALNLAYDSGEFARNMDDALARADWRGFEARRAAAAERGRLAGRGLAYYVETCAGPLHGSENSEVRIEEDDGVSVFIGTQSSGQGHETAFAQIVAEELGVAFESIRVLEGDSDILPTGGGTAGSRSLMIGGVSLYRAVDDLVTKARVLAAKQLEVDGDDLTFEDGRFAAPGTNLAIDLLDVADAARGEAGLIGRGEFTSEAANYPNGCHVCEVEIDRETGQATIVRYTVVDDFGRVINPLLLAGQVHGGVAQGVGQALLEWARYDEESGQLLAGSFLDYCMPRADDLPDYDIGWNEIPCRSNPMGIKSAGEAGAVGAPPAVINAVVDALSQYGVRHIDMPATPERIWRAMETGTG